jgi:transposase
MEACPGSHFLDKALRAQGDEVRPMPAQYVKPFVKTNKNDFIDAAAIAEAVSRPRCASSQSRPTSSWICSPFIMRRTAVVNQIRRLLLERGITVRMGGCHLAAALPDILEDGSTSLSGTEATP